MTELEIATWILVSLFIGLGTGFAFGYFHGEKKTEERFKLVAGKEGS